MNIRISMVALGLAVALLVSCKPSDVDDPVVARIGDRAITAGEFAQEMERRSPGRPLYFKSEENRRKLLRDLARHHMLVQEAHDAGIADEPEFRALVERLLIQRLRETRLDEKLQAGAADDDAVADYYKSNLDAFTRPDRRQVAMIRVDVPRTAGEDERAERLEYIEAAREATSKLSADTRHFGPLAVEFSDDRSSRYQGGVVGWLIDAPERNYQWPDKVLEAAFVLEEPGATTPVIETPDAFYLVRLAAFEPGRVQPLEHVADGIRHRLTRERARALEDQLFADIEQRHSLKIDEAVFESVEPPPALPAGADQSRKPPALPAGPAD